MTETQKGQFDDHHTWEDWTGMAFGVLIGLSPWLADQQDQMTVMWNASLVGALVITLAGLGLVGLQRWEEMAELACGLWLIGSPLLFGYGDALAVWHFALGGAVAALALLELWQDWTLSEQELARHGQ